MSLIPVDKAGFEKMFIMLRHFKKRDREDYIDRIHRLNSNLHKLVIGAPQTAADEVNKVRKDVVGHYQRVRKHAISLYDALKERSQTSSCPCQVCAVHLYYHRFIC